LGLESDLEWQKFSKRHDGKPSLSKLVKELAETLNNEMLPPDELTI